MSTVQTGQAGVTIGRRSLQQLHAVLDRQAGAEAALLLREIGFATGGELFEGFERWVAERFHVAGPRELDSRFLSEALSGFFAGTGWGEVAVSELTPSVLALDMAEWA